jgi:hypothetical protein
MRDRVFYFFTFLIVLFACVSCDRTAGRYISIHYSGGSLEFQGNKSKIDEVQIDSNDPNVSSAKRISQLEKDLARVTFVSSAGGTFESPITFSASNVTFQEAVDELMRATGSKFHFKFQRTPTQRVSIRTKNYYPEEILEKIADFYGFALVYEGSMVTFYDKDEK